MPNSNQLWEDMEKLNMMYEELMWDPDDELDFFEKKNKNIFQ